jgi:trimeric autotransporter adhesin
MSWRWAAGARQITVWSDGTVLTGKLQVTVTPPFVAEPNRCQGSAFADGYSCAINVVFAPVKAGNQAGALTVEASPGGSAKADLTGVGGVPGLLEIVPQTYDFGEVAVGASAPPKTFQLRNSGASAVAVAVTINSSAFAVVRNWCTGGMGGGGQACEVDVEFHPPAPGDHAAQLTIRRGVPDGGCGGGGVAVAALRGTGR